MEKKWGYSGHKKQFLQQADPSTGAADQALRDTARPQGEARAGHTVTNCGNIKGMCPVVIFH